MHVCTVKVGSLTNSVDHYQRILRLLLRILTEVVHSSGIIKASIMHIDYCEGINSVVFDLYFNVVDV